MSSSDLSPRKKVSVFISRKWVSTTACLGGVETKNDSTDNETTGNHISTTHHFLGYHSPTHQFYFLSARNNNSLNPSLTTKD